MSKVKQEWEEKCECYRRYRKTKNSKKKCVNQIMSSWKQRKEEDIQIFTQIKEVKTKSQSLNFNFTEIEERRKLTWCQKISRVELNISGRATLSRNTSISTSHQNEKQKVIELKFKILFH